MGWKIPDSVKDEQAKHVGQADDFVPMPVDQRPPMLKYAETIATPVKQAPVKNKTGPKQREERLRIASRNGTIIPPPDEPPPAMTQRQHDAELLHAKGEMFKLEQEARVKRGDRPIVRGCTTCDPSRRLHGPDCVGHCELSWR